MLAMTGFLFSVASAKPYWPPTYNLSLSTMTFPDGNHSGLDQGARLALEARYGLISFGWEMGICQNAIPSSPKGACTHSHTEYSLDENVRNIKAINPLARVILYRNTELGLSPYGDQCAKMYDPKFKGYWLQDKAGNILNDPAHPGEFVPCPDLSSLVQDQYFTDFRNKSAADWFVNTVVGRVANSSNADGVWFDDPSGIGAEHKSILDNFTP